MKPNPIHLVLVSTFDQKPDSLLAAFARIETAERFIPIQQGIYFPYKRWEIAECELVKELDKEAEDVFVLMVETKQGEPYLPLLSFDTEEGAERFIKDKKDAGAFPYFDYEVMETELD